MGKGKAGRCKSELIGLRDHAAKLKVIYYIGLRVKGAKNSSALQYLK